MTRYTTACEEIIKSLLMRPLGIALVVVPPSEQPVVAQVMNERLPGWQRVELSSSVLLEGPQYAMVAGLPRETEARKNLLSELNDRRDWISSHGRCLLLLLDRYELAELQRYAGDVYSARRLLEVVPFEPDPSVDPDQARAALAQWLRRRFGHLDLRGFIRSEAEDVSWRVEDIYQEILATTWSPEKNHVERIDLIPLQTWMELNYQFIRDKTFKRTSFPRSIPVTILGHPGSGKTFFLRWLTLTAIHQQRMLGIEHPLPLLLSLSTYSQMPEPADILDCIIENLLREKQPAAHIIKRAIIEKRAVFLFDGLDEVSSEFWRRKVVKNLQVFTQQVQGCPVIVTSRVTGYDAAALMGYHLLLAPFSEKNIEDFLARWCELYACMRLGDTPAVRNEGREEGQRLAQQVLSNPGILELARNPLLLTVLAIVHRAGVRLPDHRVELYAHAARVLVERWNRFRSLSRTEPAPPLKFADSVRLLGPVALDTIKRGARGAVPEEKLRESLARAIKQGNLRGVTTADEAIDLFRNALGLLVEQGPSLFAFLHLTLAEYFAALELIRSGELEALAADPMEAFDPKWREVLLLAAGELGINRSDDLRLTELVDALIDSATRRSDQPASTIPALLSGLLVDDPGLSNPSVQKLIHTLIPTWWFKQRYPHDEVFPGAVIEGIQSVQRIAQGHLADELRARVAECYAAGPPPDIMHNLSDSGAHLGNIMNFILFLRAVGVDEGPSILRFLTGTEYRWKPLSSLNLQPASIQADVAQGKAIVRFVTSRWLDEQIRSQQLPLMLNILLADADEILLGITIANHTVPWLQAKRVGDYSPTQVLLDVQLPWEGEVPPNLTASIEVATPSALQ